MSTKSDATYPHERLWIAVETRHFPGLHSSFHYEAVCGSSSDSVGHYMSGWAVLEVWTMAVTLPADQDYAYKPLQTLHYTIRILILLPGHSYKPIRCTIDQGSLSEAQPFAALSCTWGTSRRSEDIELHGRRFSIRFNLYQFLEQLREQQETLAIGRRNLYQPTRVEEHWISWRSGLGCPE